MVRALSGPTLPRSWLVGRGHHVTVLDGLSGVFVDNVVEGAEFVQGSVNDVDLVPVYPNKEGSTMCIAGPPTQQKG